MGFEEIQKWFGSLPSWAQIAVPAGALGAGYLLYRHFAGGSPASSGISAIPQGYAPSAEPAQSQASGYPVASSGSSGSGSSALLAALSQDQAAQSAQTQNLFAALQQSQTTQNSQFAGMLAQLSASQQGLARQTQGYLSGISSRVSGLSGQLATLQTASNPTTSSAQTALRVVPSQEKTQNTASYPVVAQAGTTYPSVLHGLPKTSVSNLQGQAIYTPHEQTVREHPYG